MGIKLRLILLSLLISSAAFATHIVGGSLTYVYNGGSNYTITLKLYRDCSPTSAAFPGTVTINVAGYNGAAFSPSKDITMVLGTVTPVPSNLDPCALPPTPLPCVQEAIYTTTVNNLPPNPGGYHLSYQIVARNLSLTNVNATCNCVGESFYAYIPGTSVRWFEEFNLPNGTTTDAGATAWSIAAGATPPSGASVQNGQFEITGANNAVEKWTSQVISTSACGTFNVRVDLSENGNLDANDSIKVYYRLNGGPITLFPVNGNIVDDFGSAVASVSGLTGATIQIIIRTSYDGNSPGSEIYRFDNVAVSCNDFFPNSNPVFNLFPPLFLCVGNPFTFNHAATDADGDSLHYSFYTPYNGDTGPGPLDPTYAANTANFTPIVFLPGYSATNPLGGPPLNLNPNTGLMTGTPTMLGQFVVGVVVKEYRNGNYVSQTLRDFQFNIVNCPPPPVAVGGTNITINDGCTGQLTATGFTPSTVTWNSITGVPGTYNSYLSCTTGCLNPSVTPSGTPPPFVDYQVCGITANCNPTLVCDTVRVTFNPTLLVSIAPINPTICFGGTSTTITATGSGGTPPYSYLWNSINPSPSITVGPGNYTVQLSDASGCPPTTATVTVTAFAVAITANAGPDQNICLQGSPSVTLNGSVTGASGGAWSGGAGVFSPNSATLNAIYTPTPSEIAAGAVTLTLTTTGNGTCPAGSDAVTITFSNFTGTVTTTPTPVSCFGGNNGSAIASVAGGSPPHTYAWNTVPMQTGATATNLAVGSYTVTITNSIGCTATGVAVITQPPLLNVNAVTTNVSCSGGNNGSVAVTPVGGTPGYTYLWSPGGQTTSTISGQTAGTYTVTVTDSRGCTRTSSYSITQPAPVTVTFTQTNVSCSGGSDGTVTATAAGGTPGYSYSWVPSGGTASTATGLAAGSYTVTVTDSRGCTATGSVTITQPVVLTASVVSTNESCSTSNNGTATVTPGGGTPGYTFLWMPGGMTTVTVGSLAAGTYTVTVTDSRGCSVSNFATITQPAALTATASNTAVSCFGGASGTVSATVTGGTAGYTYSWAPGGASTATVAGVAAGTYTVTVTDANTCTATAVTSVTEPASAVTASAALTNPRCNGGTNGFIVLSASGGTPGYTYLWLPGGQTTPNISGLGAGTYTITITDSKGCQFTTSYTLTEPAPIVITATKVNVSCFGGNDGSLSMAVTGGTPPYSYTWSPSVSTGPVASGLPAGSYLVVVTDSRGCSRFLTQSVTQPPVLSATVSVTGETCSYSNNGSATVSVSGGSPGYSYLWSPGGMTTAGVSSLSTGTYTVITTDSKGCTISTVATISEPSALAITYGTIVNVSCFGGANGVLSASVTGGTPSYSYSWAPGGGTSNVYSGLSAGTYTLTVTDNRGCTATSTATITQPAAALSASPAFVAPSCNGASNGSLSVSAAGGTGPYTFLWMPGFFSGSAVAGVSAGSYTVTATDNQGCTATASITVTEPAPMVLTTSTVNSNCGTASGQASVAVSGGVPPYTYAWSPSGGTGAVATGLVSGPYAVVVTDANGCTNTQWANVNDNAGPTATIFAVINVTCNGGSDGSASVSVAGGTGPYSFSWSPSGGTASTASGLAAGTYTVTVTDATGCISNATTSPAITEPPPISIVTSSTAASCFGGTNGSVSAVASGGTPGYSYLWLPMGTPGASIPTGLAAGTYTVQVTDANLCVQTAAVTVTQPSAAVSVAVSSTPVSCFGGSNGTATSIASGGTPPYSYTWAPGSVTGPSMGGIAVGTYTVTVTDLNGCTVSASTVITQPTPVSVTSGSDNAACGTASGLAYVNASGGIPPYSYFWSPGGSTNDTASALTPGTYSVSVSDNNGCGAILSVVVNNTPGPVATISSIGNVSCFGGSNGSASVNVVGGVVPYSYSWSPSGGTGATASGLSAGTYTVTVTDANGCISSDTTDPGITEPDSLIVNVSFTDLTCFGSNNGTAAASVFGGTAPYSYLWSPGGSTAASLSALAAGTYTVQVTDANSCNALNIFTVNQPAVMNASISALSNVSCFGGANGSATVSAAGGSAVYSYDWTPSGGTSATASGLPAGSYTVTVTDQNGCTASASVVITQPASALTLSISGTPVSCNGGSDGTATVLASGGTPGYTYSWSPSGNILPTATGLSFGIHVVIVTDNNGCQANSGLFISQPPAISGNLAVTPPSCGFSNGVISALVSGGSGPYSYSWTPGGMTTATVTGLAPGSYTVQVTDNAGCTFTLNTTLTNIPGPVVSLASSTNVSCNSGSDGSATVNIVSGTFPYSMVWAPYGGTLATASGLTADTYTVTVTDNLGCTASATVVITEPSMVGINVSSVTNVSCNSGANGAITVNGTGGTPGYTYSWAPIVSTSPSVSGLSAGTYTVTVTDLAGCTTAVPVTITEPTTLASATGTMVQPSCFGSSNGSISVIPSGGTIPYSYLWSDGQTGNPAVGLTAGTYSVVVTDANGCVTALTMNLGQPTQIITSAGINDTICIGSTATISASASGGGGGYFYTWQPGAAINSGTYNVSPVVNTTYTVTAYDASGCAGTTDTVSVIVYNLTASNITAMTTLSPICPGQNSSVYVLTSGTTGALTYTWNNGLGSGVVGSPGTELEFAL